MKIDVTYISAPEYLMKYKTKDPKKGMKEFEEKLKTIVSEAEEASYNIIED